jgi:hypothetical protein
VEVLVVHQAEVLAAADSVVDLVVVDSLVVVLAVVGRKQSGKYKV